MDRTMLDALMRRVARQTTRRAALAALLGGALLLHAPAASEATKEAERRKDHRRKQRRRQAKTASLLKPIALWIDNTAGTNPVTVEHGENINTYRCCTHINTVTIPPGERVRFASNASAAYVWIDEYYWLSFLNPPFYRPGVSAAYSGQQSGDFWCCKPPGFTVLLNHDLSVGQSVAFNLDGHVFSATRNRDTNYKEFTLTLPAEL